jgi:hypothetical protein
MHARDLVELAALVAIHSPVLIHGGGRVPKVAIEEYWTASRCRLDRWTRLLRRLADAGTQLPIPATLNSTRVQPVLEEILASELLTRLWTAASVAYDRHRDDEEVAPVARNVFHGHLEVRRRLLQLLSDGRAIELGDAVTLNHLRRRVERWTDMLLAHLARDVDVSEFAFEPERALEFAEDLAPEAVAAERQFTSQLILSSLRAAFQTNLAERSPNLDLNRRIGAALLGCFREGLFDSSSLIKPLWVERLSATADDAQGMIDELVRIDDAQTVRRAMPR